jgi:hypothetical protein
MRSMIASPYHWQVNRDAASPDTQRPEASLRGRPGHSAHRWGGVLRVGARTGPARKAARAVPYLLAKQGSHGRRAARWLCSDRAAGTSLTTGTGKPERLKELGGEVWSRRITEKDRLVYDIESDVITIVACRFHHDDH